MHEPEDKKDDLGSKLEGLWDKVSKGVEEGFKVGKEEIVRTAKIGKIRLDVASLKSNKNEKIKLLGGRTYGLLQSGEVKIAPLDDLLEEIKGIDAQIDSKEEEIQTIMAEKSATAGEEEGEEAVVVEEATPEEEVTPASEPAKKKKTKKKKTTPAAGEEPPEDTEGKQESAEDKAEE